MCGGIHYGEVEGLVSVEWWSCSRGASCGGIHYGEVEGLVSVERWSLGMGASRYKPLPLHRIASCTWPAHRTTLLVIRSFPSTHTPCQHIYITPIPVITQTD